MGLLLADDTLDFEAARQRFANFKIPVPSDLEDLKEYPANNRILIEKTIKWIVGDVRELFLKCM